MTKEQNKKAPNLRFKGFTNDWEQRKLGDISKSFSGGTPSAGHKEFYGGNIPFIRSAEINSDSTQLFLTQAGLINSSAKLVSKGTLLFALYGATSGETGIAQIDGAINQAIMAIKVNKGNTYFVKSWFVKHKNHITSTYLQGGQGNLSAKIIKKLLIKLPTLEEQGKVSNLIAQVDKLITLQQRKLELLKEIKKGLLQKMFADKSKFPILRFEGFHAEWEQRKLGEVIELEDNKRKPVKASKRIPGNIPYYGANGIQDYVKGYTHTGEHVLVAEDGANSISNYPVYFICSPSWINNHSHVLTGKGSIISNKFLTYNLKTVPYAKYLVGSGRYKLNAETLKIIPIKLPLLTEQNYIGSTLSKIDKLITLQHQRLSKLNEIKKSLLQQMFI
ncbi:restriction endonuclease subunit S [Limosilactobacillus reuteri]|uniref:restriction endonuclease subunit S n=1 Tax=Limosilactobacillus reuteri TaxID=1598 RepID=UPI001E41636C|nr:restriction endonuclease subunit S [Limosilactobacillus reuteri]MCC4342616.1 restriction endonuclease subunit S [Limosilactobacillus reuteri]